MLKNIAVWFFFVGLAFSSVYIWPSGNPQPSDFAVSMAAVLILASRMPRLFGFIMLWPMVALTLWVIMVSMAWTILYPDGDFLKYPIFFVFNLIFMFAVVNLFSMLKNPVCFFQRVIEVALLVSGMGIALSVLDPGIVSETESARIKGFFNNPNQLAYYSLCMLASLLVLCEGRMPGRPVAIVAFVCGVLGIFIGASLAAMAGFMFILFAIVIANWKNPGRSIKVMGGGLVVMALTFGFDVYTDGSVSERFQIRMDRAGTKVEDLETERGYHRIRAHPEYLFLGAAEGAFERFPGYGAYEIHSSFGNLLFAYGAVGLSLFLLFLWRAIKGAQLYVYFILAAPLVYSLAHVGLRSTAFWLLLTVILLMGGQKGIAQRHPTKLDKRRALRNDVDGRDTGKRVVRGGYWSD